MGFIHFSNVLFHYKNDQNFALNIADLAIEKNSHVFIEGPSGCGKTTFLNVLTGLIQPKEGCIQVLNTDITKLSLTQCDQFRADHFGIIFQLFNLIPYLTIIENIMLPCTFSKQRKENALQQSKSLEEEAKRLCNELDISDDLLTKSVQDLSIGQQQRVAIARALIGQPEIIIADEPTSALDDERKDQFMRVLLNECEKYNATLILVSHDQSLKRQFSKVFHLNELNSSEQGIR